METPNSGMRQENGRIQIADERQNNKYETIHVERMR